MSSCHLYHSLIACFFLLLCTLKFHPNFLFNVHVNSFGKRDKGRVCWLAVGLQFNGKRCLNTSFFVHRISNCADLVPCSDLSVSTERTVSPLSLNCESSWVPLAPEILSWSLKVISYLSTVAIATVFYSASLDFVFRISLLSKELVACPVSSPDLLVKEYKLSSTSIKQISWFSGIPYGQFIRKFPSHFCRTVSCKLSTISSHCWPKWINLRNLWPRGKH